MLSVQNITAAYGKVQVLRDLSFTVAPGEILCLSGRNGAGKSTALKAIMGQVRVSSGTITLDGIDISALPAFRIPKLGIGYIPQGRRVFDELTVRENLDIGLMAASSGKQVLDRVLTMFPRLRERLDQRADTLSGSEQQMLATARALCLEPRVLLLDEPTEGLQPSMIALIRDALVILKQNGVAIVLVEQRVKAVLQIADRVAFIENGRAALQATPADIRRDMNMVHRFVSV